MILQLNPTIPVNCKVHGDGEAILIIDYGPNVNTVWVVRFPGGIIKHFYSDDVRVYGNPMDGKGWDLKRFPKEFDVITEDDRNFYVVERMGDELKGVSIKDDKVVEITDSFRILKNITP